MTISEIKNYGFYVEKFNDLSKSFTAVSDLIPGAGTTLVPQTYFWIDDNAVGDNLQYRLKQIDTDGLISFHGPIMLNPTSVDNERLPDVFALSQNYPNPFNPSTIINYQLTNGDYTTLKVYNLIGIEVATLVNGYKPAGYHSVTLDGTKLASGVYFYKLQSGSNIEIKKLILTR